jgi:HAD superfamily hydrolase (TIGR01484 family)
MNNPKFILVFDVDGVLTDPQTKQTDIQILNKIEGFISDGVPVAFNTGRSYSWLEKEILSHFSQKVFVSCEKGAIWGVFDETTFNQRIDSSISVPEVLKNEVRELIDKEYKDCVFYDEAKMTMITAEMRSDFPLQDFPARQKSLSKALEDIVEKMGLKDKLRVLETTIDVEIEDIKMGKDLGAKRILSLLEEQRIYPQEFITIGDGKSDLFMAKEFSSQGFKTQFVFVGEGTLEDKENFPVISTQQKFVKGTSEFLENLGI